MLYSQTFLVPKYCGKYGVNMKIGSRVGGRHMPPVERGGPRGTEKDMWKGDITVDGEPANPAIPHPKYVAVAKVPV